MEGFSLAVGVLQGLSTAHFAFAVYAFLGGPRLLLWPFPTHISTPPRVVSAISYLV